ncbi:MULTISPECIES: DUF6232 family protein [Streptomyces]|uniref:Flippase GtrA n=1 Tax=Streptomyces clavifer TaxID=68188 RepID=A0ABS4VBE9_9ACTN|nr:MULTISPECIES: DUF6232 family protein [Streptomyces]KQX78815.1 hypothetical protein ASD26_09865 [Streptomyces sp. Root1319]KQZ03843.1 hypothetical protein ASD51_18680 [Streptomyces sp. Root55]MBP2361148.1 putative flippase GtrA [Streptomyces clavifer]MDX2746220.1 DUF6232 family protein [Streptomyces sp. NRRL_B-2557]MDX3064458.1 DUF6232 family protein [Streptomyces sp. ND04-05B]
MPAQTVELRIGKRLLWVGGAAYPLHNIARVYTFVLKPKRQEATMRFLKRVGLTLAVLMILTMIGEITFLGSDDSDGFVRFAWVGGLVALVVYVTDLLTVLTATSHHVVAIETAGPSTAMVTGRNTEHLKQLVGYIANAIENPEAEFHVQVERLMISSPQNYHFGDNVNMYGGSGNVGITHA